MILVFIIGVSDMPDILVWLIKYSIHCIVGKIQDGYLFPRSNNK